MEKETANLKLHVHRLVVEYCWSHHDEPIAMEGLKPLLSEFVIYHRLESFEGWLRQQRTRGNRTASKKKIAYMRGDAAASQMLLINQLLHNDLLPAKENSLRVAADFRT